MVMHVSNTSSKSDLVYMLVGTSHIIINIPLESCTELFVTQGESFVNHCE